MFYVKAYAHTLSPGDLISESGRMLTVVSINIIPRNIEPESVEIKTSGGIFRCMSRDIVQCSRGSLGEN